MPRYPKPPVRVDMTKIRFLTDDEKLRLLTSPRHNERRPNTAEQKSLKSSIQKGKPSWNTGLKVKMPAQLQKTVGFAYSRTRDPLGIPVVFGGWKSSTR